MTICGIIAEYDPFHNGHAHHIAETRAALGEDTAVVCAMSGNFVQRGEPAVFEKHARAEAAVLCGADLVLELPLPWAMASAERFADGAVALLEATGVVTHLSFGSESGDLDAMHEIAELLLRPEMDGLIREELASGVSYAAARQRAAETLAGRPAELLSQPNHILGIEYLKAIRRRNAPLTPLTVRRAGAGHDAPGEGAGENPSASWLRQRLAAGEEISSYVPPKAAEVFRRETPVFPETLETALLSRLRMLPGAAFAALPDASEGVENRLCRAAREEPDLGAVLAAAASRRYAVSRLRRMLWGAALGLTGADGAGEPPYLRVLSANARGRALLAEMRAAAALPVITKPAAARELDQGARRVFELEAGATDLFVLGFSDPERRRGGAEWRAGPVIL